MFALISVLPSNIQDTQTEYASIGRWKTSLQHSLYSAFKSLPVRGLIRLITSGLAPVQSHRTLSIVCLPNELLLEIFSFLELRPYIICHGICKKWQQLLPSTQMDPKRRRLLDLYRGIRDTEDFEKTLEWTDQHLQPFDREEYVRCLLTQYPAIPEEFRMWILEWPARLVIHGIWPGLPFINCRTTSMLVRRPGVNWIAYRSFSPQLSSLIYKHRTPSQTFIPGLFIWSYATETDWLIFEQDEPDLFGRVYIINASYHHAGTFPYYPPRQDIGDHDDDDDDDTDSEYSEGEKHVVFFNDWVSYLEYLWGQTTDWIRDPPRIFLRPDPPIKQPIWYKFDIPGNDSLPAPRWENR